MKKYLITGFSGFVSRHFLEYLENNEIRASIKGLDIHNPEFNSPRDNKLIVGSNKKLKDLGWNRRYVLEDSLKDVIEFWKSS